MKKAALAQHCPRDTRKTGEVPSDRNGKLKFAGRNKVGLVSNAPSPWHDVASGCGTGYEEEGKRGRGN